jgi:antirestriction protein
LEGIAAGSNFWRPTPNEVLQQALGSLSQYFDYEAFGRDLFMYDYTMGANGNVFRNL